ncbi:hypothetical protein D3C75_875800 [compost metagenome]
MMLCLPQLQQQGAECFFAVGQNPRFRTEGNRCPGQPLRQTQQLLAGGIKNRPVLMIAQRIILNPLISHQIALCLFIIFAALEHVLSKEKIKDKPEYRYKRKQQNPGHGCGGIAVFHEDSKPDGDDGQRGENTDDCPGGTAENAKTKIIKCQ